MRTVAGIGAGIFRVARVARADAGAAPDGVSQGFDESEFVWVSAPRLEEVAEKSPGICPKPAD